MRNAHIVKDCEGGGRIRAERYQDADDLRVSAPRRQQQRGNFVFVFGVQVARKFQGFGAARCFRRVPPADGGEEGGVVRIKRGGSGDSQVAARLSGGVCEGQGEDGGEVG